MAEGIILENSIQIYTRLLDWSYNTHNNVIYVRENIRSPFETLISIVNLLM